MQQPPLALRDIFSTKVRVTIYGALVLFIAAIAAPQVFAQSNNADAEEVSESTDEPSYTQPPRVYEVKGANKNTTAAEASDDSVRDALRSVFKETAPERIKDKVVPPVSKAAAARSLKQPSVKPEASPEDEKELKQPKDVKVAKESSAKSAASKSTAKHKVAFSGVADYYADRFHGKKTASGQLHDKTKMTAAHLSLPFGTKVKVVSRHTGKSCVVTVNDRGPYTKNRIIDLSFAAAKELGLVTAGSRLVDCYLIEPE
ncbi:MAG: septal ring lytic transglycosylase RlpA family protein [Candidatus Obscuribacterales bacterium]|nr:septal ring lytic transglycosylase RlpA family protein [Candidatus Obscuribacterales bacterium]